jgi:hypothetical protein
MATMAAGTRSTGRLWRRLGRIAAHPRPTANPAWTSIGKGTASIVTTVLRIVRERTRSGADAASSEITLR